MLEDRRIQRIRYDDTSDVNATILVRNIYSSSN